MKAAVVNAWGDTPTYSDYPDPEPQGGTVVADVEASSLTNLTRGLVSGKHYASKQIQLPTVPGFDGVARLEDGRRVYAVALPGHGMMAHRTLVAKDGAFEIPAGVDSVTAAAIPNPGMSAWMALEYGAAVKPGDHVLVLGATGVTGATAVQLTKTMFGAERVVVAGRDTTRLDWLRTVGADDAIAMRSEDLAGRVAELHAERPFDAVLDYLWGEPAQQTLQALADSHPASTHHATRWVQIGSMAGMTLTLPAGVLRSSGITLSGIGIGSVPPDVMARARNEGLPKLLDMVADGRLQLSTQARPLADVADAWTSAEPSGTRVVLVP
ncbi:MAG: zinc-binding alcohol dehydrogenase family protein [Mycobacterium sp.]